MIPLRDLNPRSTFPIITILLIAANLAIFFYQLSLGPRAEHQLIFTYGMIPARISLALEHRGLPFREAFAPLLTSMFLHGSLLHVLGNMLFLWIFGDNVEDHLGHFRYLMFYLICGLGAGLLHAVVNLGSTLPAVGASGAISGVMGAYIVLFPRARVVTLVPLVFFFFTVRLPAIVLLGYWFLIQFLGGLGSLGVRDAGGVAWWAHIGGFILGGLLGSVSRRR